MDRDSRHNPILKQQLRRYGPRSIFPQKSPFRARFGAFYPHPAHKSAPTAEWATDSGHCSLASRPTPNQRGEVVCRPSPAGYRLPPTAEFPETGPGTISTSGPLYYSVRHRTRRFVRASQTIFPACRRPTVDHSHAVESSVGMVRAMPTGGRRGAPVCRVT